MPKFRVTFAGSADDLLSATRTDALDAYSEERVVEATSEADSVFAFNRELGSQNGIVFAPEPGERYFVTRIIEQPEHLVEVTGEKGKPIVRATPIHHV